MVNWRNYLTTAYNFDATVERLRRKYRVDVEQRAGRDTKDDDTGRYTGRATLHLADFPNHSAQLFTGGRKLMVQGDIGRDHEILTKLEPDIVTTNGEAFEYALLNFAPGRDWQNAMFYGFSLAKLQYYIMDTMLNYPSQKMVPAFLETHNKIGEMLEKIERLYLPSLINPEAFLLIPNQTGEMERVYLGSHYPDSDREKKWALPKALKTTSFS